MLISIFIFILGIVFLFIAPPLGIGLLIISVICFVFKVVTGTGQVALNTGKFITKTLTTKKCPYCYSQIDAKATVCPACHKDIIEYNSVKINTEKNEEIEYNDESYTEASNEENTINENNTIDYKEKSLELSKIYNLYKNEIYNEQEYKSKKEKWIESLKQLNFSKVETDFLNEILPFIKDGILESKELEIIKYIVSGEYAKDKYREKQEQRIKREEEARKKREEAINNIKNKTKEITSNTVDKISSIVSYNSNKIVNEKNISVCECGEKIEEEDIYCGNCGRELK